MRKALVLLVMMFGLMCSGQEVITNYIYTVNEVTNYVYTVSNITHITYNEITQKVTRAYNYYSTNFTYNVETNLYIDTLIGTNVTINIETNTYNIYTNIYAQTNLTVDITTNYNTYITLTNFEGWAARCETAESNSLLYAYIANDAVLHLGSTNSVFINTNVYYYTDITGTVYSNITCLAFNDIDGAICASNIASTLNRKAVHEYDVRYGGFTIGKCVASHAMQTQSGLVLLYLPTNTVFRKSGTSTYYWKAGYVLWHAGSLKICVSGFADQNGTSFRSNIVRYLDDPTFPNSFGSTRIAQIGNQFITIVANDSGLDSVYFPIFPSLLGWRYMWWYTLTTQTTFY